jgi:hypothetical protein
MLRAALLLVVALLPGPTQATAADHDALYQLYPTQRTVFNAVADGLIWTRIPSIVQVGGASSPKLLAMARAANSGGQGDRLAPLYPHGGPLA